MKRLVMMVLLSSLLSCIDPVELPIRSETPRLVVDGLITNEPPPYSVRLSYSGDFTFEQESARDQKVTDATVTLSDDTGQSTVLAHDPFNPGYYRTTDLAFTGQPGRSYTLTLTLADGTRYASQPERMPPVPPIDTVYADLNRSETDLFDSYRFAFYIDTNDPGNEQNFYGWTATSYNVQGSPPDYCWVKTENQRINIFTDKAVNGKSIRRRPVVQSPIRSIGPHFVEVKQYSLSQRAYQFYRLFEEQQTRTGTIFDPLPASVIGNISQIGQPDERALGYFRASATTTKRTRFYSEEVYRPAVQQYLATLQANRRTCCSGPCFLELRYNPPGFND